MAQNATLPQLSATLDFFNDSLNEPNKLSGKALQTIQEYLNNPQVRSLDEEDDKNMQFTLKHLEKLREPTIIGRVSAATIEKINQQLENVEEIILENSEEILEDAYFVVVNLEVCFLVILSEETVNFGKQRQKFIEEEIKTSEMSKLSVNTLCPDAFYLDKQQRLISELMNAALFNILEYFQKERQSFTKSFTKQFLDSLDKKVKNPNHLFEDKMSNDVFSLLSITSNDCKLPMSDLIHHLRYAIIGFGERLNDFAEPLQEYIRKTKSPTLAGFNKTLCPAWALTAKEVNVFSGLFGLYHKILLPTAAQEKFVPAAGTSIAAGEPTPPLTNETDLKCVWIESSDVEKYYGAFERTIKPASDHQFTPEEFSSEISDDWIKSRIFLCLSATNARTLLPKIHSKVKLYRVYVLCNEKLEENQFLRDDESFGQIHLITSDEETFIKQIALDIVPSLIEVGDVHLKEKQKDNARRWYRSAEVKITKYDKSENNRWHSIIQEKKELC